MYVNAPVLARAADPDALLAFFQTQRTASRALTRWLAAILGEDRVYYARFVEDFRRWPQLDGDTLAPFRAFAGFSAYEALSLRGRPVAAFASVRHPLFRLASLYEMSRTTRNHLYHALARSGSFEQYYREGSADRPYYFRNLCAQRIGGRASYEAARVAMEESFGAVAAMGELDAFTRLLAETCGWDAAPMPRQPEPDAVKYANYLNSPLAGEILAANQEDLSLFEFVVGVGEARADESSTIATKPRNHPPCPLCGDPMAPLKPPDYCPGCNMPPRVRSLPRLMDEAIKPWLASHDRTDLPLFAFAATRAEQKVLRKTWHELKSVSLYNSYGRGHQSGVDVRDLSRFAEASFGGAMSILLFDYFPEHERALAELYRVLAPGAAFFTLILTSRVTDGADPPSVMRRIEPRPGYFDYVPAGEELLSVRVGRAWFVQAMQRAGFEARSVQIQDPASGQTLEWFVGFKPDAGAEPRPARVGSVKKAAAGADGLTRGAAFSREYQRDVDPDFGFRRIALTLRVPRVSEDAQGCDFAEHIVGRRTVIGLGVGRALLSEDLGESWRSFELEGGEDALFQMCFTTASGHHLLQTKATEANERNPATRPMIYRYTPDWKLAGKNMVGDHNWHGRASIGEADGTIMWAEYPYNEAKFAKGREREALTSKVWRSRDDGLSWEPIFAQSSVRHFHTIQPDPYVPRQWWLSSGDRPKECRIWVSGDDGDNWVEATNFSPDATALYPSIQNPQSVQRFTDISIGQDALIWGSDDWLGGHENVHDPAAPPHRRAGSRMFRSPRAVPLQPESIGWIGNPVRSLVDIGPALLALTEGKRPALPEPQVYLVAKDRPLVQQLFTIDVIGGAPTGFTYSRASARAEDGHFFSFRGVRDLAWNSLRMLHWHVALD